MKRFSGRGIRNLIGSALLVGTIMIPTVGMAATLSAGEKQSDAILAESGELSPGDLILEVDNSLYDVYEFSGQQGQTVVISMTSDDFDTYLGLLGPDGSVVAENDDSNGTTDSQITVALPSSGTYTVIANSYDDTGR
ncbi:MAG: PPC domain-containing protein, partial [Cyanobacteria bacterium J06638_22]